MKKRIMGILAAGFAACVYTAPAADLSLLPKPRRQGGVSLMQALCERKTTRDFQAKELPRELLSDLLWAANGINRPDGRRTAPTGLNVQDLDVYVMLPSGVYRYDPAGHALKRVNAGDHRAVAGRQPFARRAPLNLFYVQDTTRAMKTDELAGARYAGVHAGAVMQNVYLFCAHAKLGCVARGSFDAKAVAAALKLTAAQRVILAQTVGYPVSGGRIGPEAAKRIALGHAGFTEYDVRDLSCELDREDGVWVYEVEFDAKKHEYEYEIDAVTGTIRKSKKSAD